MDDALVRSLVAYSFFGLILLVIFGSIFHVFIGFWRVLKWSSDRPYKEEADEPQKDIITSGEHQFSSYEESDEKFLSARYGKLLKWILLAISPFGVSFITFIMQITGSCRWKGGLTSYCELFSHEFSFLNTYIETINTCFMLSTFLGLPLIWLPLAFSTWLVVIIRIFNMIACPKTVIMAPQTPPDAFPRARKK